jgi:murein L,D-transpeptidase YcbB/YkuD
LLTGQIITAAAATSSSLWLVDGRPTRPASALLTLIEAATDYGLNPADYGVDRLRSLGAVPSAGSAAGSGASAEFDRELSEATLHFLHDVHAGRVDPRLANFDLREPRREPDYRGLLQRLAKTDRPAALVAEVEPNFVHYRLLKQWLHRYRELTAAGEPPLPARPGTRALRPGDEFAGAAALRRRLQALGDMPPDEVGDVPRYDAQLAAGIARFQSRHGLESDGVLGNSTWNALQVPLRERVRQIELTLERWRWLPEFATPPLIINIPQFRLFMFHSTTDRAADIEQMSVIVGQAYRHTRTPVFIGDIRYVVFRPYWDVPRSILLRELLPELRADPAGYLARNRMEIVRGAGDDARRVEPTAENLDGLQSGSLRLRQLPGEDNALGLLKFVLPNDYGVYLHGTPAVRLFERARRDFSHGCIRVSDPVALADHVLKNAGSDWNSEEIRAATQGVDNQRVALRTPMRVMVLYGTALATEAGELQFFDDIYGHDRQLAHLLAQP